MEVFQSEWKTNTHDGRTSKHTEYRYVKKCQTFQWKCQIASGNTRNMSGQKVIEQLSYEKLISKISQSHTSNNNGLNKYSKSFETLLESN